MIAESHLSAARFERPGRPGGRCDARQWGVARRWRWAKPARRSIAQAEARADRKGGGRARLVAIRRWHGRRSPDYYASRPETIEETAELVTARGGKGIAVVVDHRSRTSRDADRANPQGARTASRAGERHFGEQLEHDFGKTFWQADLERRICEFPQCGSHAHHHQSFRGAFADRDSEERESPG